MTVARLSLTDFRSYTDAILAPGPEDPWALADRASGPAPRGASEVVRHGRAPRTLRPWGARGRRKGGR